MRKLLYRVALYLQGTVMTESELRKIIRELEGLIDMVKKSRNKVIVPQSLIARVTLFIDAFKHHNGIQISENPEVTGIKDLKKFLSQELGIEVNRDYMFRGHRSGMPLHMFVI